MSETKRAVPAGVVLLDSIIAYLETYLVFPNPHYSRVAALWVLNTWIFQWCDAVPYLAITAETKRAGKTTLLDLLGFLAKNPEKGGAGTAASMYTLLEQYGGWATLFFDEAEKMSAGVASMMRSFMNLGYRRGETIPRTVMGGPDGRQVVKFPCWCPKAFALIGDPEDTLRDRSILFVMKRAIAPKPYRPTKANSEALVIREAIEAYLKSGALKNAEVVCPMFIDNRDQEIWEPLWSLAHALGCDAKSLRDLEAAASYFVMLKTQPIRRYTEQAGAEQAQLMEDYGEKAVRDLASVFHAGEKAIKTSEAVARMMALPRGWEAFRGIGLNEILLADMVRPLGVRPRNVRMGKQVPKCYVRADVLASVPAVRGSEV